MYDVATLDAHLVSGIQQTKRVGLNLLNRTVGRVVADRVKAAHLEQVAASKFLALSSLVSRQLPPDLPLAAHELSVFSQNGEDGVLFELCSRLSVPHSFVEFGVGQAIQGNCVLLSDVFGWSGLFIEIEEDDFTGLQAKYAHREDVQTRCEKITPQNVNSVFSGAAIPEEFGVLSIDIDGNDYWVWTALERYRPAIVVIEYNAAIPSDEGLVQPYDDEGWDGTSFFGASLRAFEDLARAKGYELVHTELAGVNAFFVRSDLIGEVAIARQVPRNGVNYYLMSSTHAFQPSDRTEWERPQLSS